MQKINQINNNTHTDYSNSNVRTNNLISTKDTFIKNSPPKMLNSPSLRASAKTLGNTDSLNLLEQSWKFHIGGIIRTTPLLSNNENIVLITNIGKKIYAINSYTGEKKWSFEIEDGILSEPFLGSDDTLYVGSANSTGEIYAIDTKSGNKKWEFTTGASITNAPSLSPDGKTTFVGNGNGNIYAIDATAGKKKWELQTSKANPTFTSSPHLSPNGKIILVGCGGSTGDNDTLYAIDTTTGEKKWEINKDYFTFSNPPFSRDGKTIFFVRECMEQINGMWQGAQKICAVDVNDGKIKWESKTRRGLIDSPLISTNGVLYAVNSDGEIFAINTTTGKELWQLNAKGFNSCPPISSADEKNLFVILDGKIHAIDVNSGKIKWRFNTGRYVSSPPCLSPDGKILLTGDCDGNLYVIDLDSGKEKYKFKTGNDIRSTPSISKNGEFIFVGSDDGHVYTFFKSDVKTKILEKIEEETNESTQKNKIIKGTDSVKIGSITLKINQRYQKI